MRPNLPCQSRERPDQVSKPVEWLKAPPGVAVSFHKCNTHQQDAQDAEARSLPQDEVYHQNLVGFAVQ